MKLTNSATILLCIMSIVQCWHFNNPYKNDELLTYQNQRVQLFDQILDHYSYLPPQFWKQRYYVTDTYFDPKTGPIILYICG